jgi:hypothetical protein
MISLASGLRIYLACGVTDMRNYVERRIMRSPWQHERAATAFREGLLRIIAGAADAVQHRQQLIRGPEPAALEHRSRGGGKRFEFFCRVCAQIDLSTLQAGVPKPEGDLSDVSRGLERVHGAGVTKYLWGNPLATDGGLRLRSFHSVLGEDVLEIASWRGRRR